MITFFKKKEGFKKEPILDCYEDLSISIYRWDRYMSTGDNNWLLKEYDGRQTKIVSKQLEDLEVKLNDDYFLLSADDKYRRILDKRLKASRINTRYIRIISICERIMAGFVDEDLYNRLHYINLLEKEGFSMPKINTYDGDIEEVLKIAEKASQFKTQIEILLKESKIESNSGKISVEKQLIQICLGLEMKIVSTRDISVIQFIELGNILKERNLALKEKQTNK